MSNNFRRYKYFYIMMIPGILWYILFHIWPLYGITIAFKNYMPMKGIMGSPWIGLEHIRNLVTSATFPTLLKNTVFISFLKLLFAFPFPIILALSIHSVSNRIFKKTIQTISYLPHFLSWVIVVGISFAFFNSYYGVLKTVFENLGLPYIDVTVTARTFVGFLVGSHIWKTAGWSSIIYLATLAGIDSQMYEAAIIDGASKWKQLIYITIPSLLPTVAIIFILSVGTLIQGDFEQIFLFQTKGSIQFPDPEILKVSEIFETYIYRMGILKTNFSFPAAMGVFQSSFAALLILFTNKLAKKLGYEGIW